MIRILTICAVFALTACDVAQPIADDIARERARSVVNATLAEKAPGANLSPLTDCVINNASAQEIFAIAKNSVTGVTADTTGLILDIAARPASVECILKNGMGLL